MAMQNYYREFFGQQNYKPWSNSGSDSSESRVISQVQVLSGVITSRGNGVLPTNQEFHKNEVNYWKGSVEQIGSGLADGFYSYVRGVLDYSPGAVPSSTFSITARNEASDDMYSQLRGQLDLSVDLAQAGQARSMVTKSIRGLRDLSSTIRRIKRALRRGDTRAVSNLWLEFTYGWKPLANSIYQTGVQLMAPSKPSFARIKGKGKVVIRIHEEGPSPEFPQVTETRHWVISQRCLVQCDFSFSDSALDTLAGFTSLNPVSIRWELVPYSFVVDWIVDIGGYLRNLENALLYSSNFVRGFFTDQYLITGGKQTYGSYRPTGSVFVNVNMNMSARKSGKRRIPLTAILMPTPPQIDLRLGTTRLFSAAALLRQQL